jgi:uroporphyrinogen decarboxylase
MSRADRFLKACRKQDVDTTPIWIMRQAGRYLPEYRSLRSNHTFMEMCKTPELAVEVTLQPLRRFSLDAAIVFSDILLPLEGMGLEVSFAEGRKPAVNPPIRTASDVHKLRTFVPEEHMPYLLESIALTSRELNGRVPLLGFSGAPFTLASYMIDPDAGGNQLRLKSLMYREPVIFQLLLEKLTDMVLAYLNAQIAHGAQAVQVFDTWAGTLSAADYGEFVLPHMVRLFSALDASVPRILFAVGGSHLIRLMEKTGCDVLGIDWRLPLDEAWSLAHFRPAIQGNLDPLALFGPHQYLANRVQDVVSRAGARKGHIFNLGHGILPSTPVDSVAFLIDLVHQTGLRLDET